MRKILISYLLSGLILAAFVPAWAQEKADSAAIDLIQIMMEHRLIWLEDSTLFSACSIYEKVGRPENLAERLGPRAGQLLDRPEDPCALPRTKGRIVALVSLAVEDSTAHMVLNVVKGSRSYTEEYTIRLFPGGDWWGVDEIKMSGWGFIHL